MEKPSDTSSEPAIAKLEWVSPLETLTSMSVAEVTGWQAQPAADGAGPDGTADAS
jgi:hypothetical protein